MRLTVVGCSGSLPGPDGPASCYLLEADGFRVLLDLGSGALGALQRHVDLFAVDAVLLSHLHPDHCLDLCPYYVARSYAPHPPSSRLPVHGPPGTAARLARAYGVGAPQGLERAFSFSSSWRPRGTYGIGPFRVTVDRVRHPVETYGMRIEHDGRTLAYSGDTDACAALVGLARDADVLLCEAGFAQGRQRERGLHLTGRQAGAQAAEAGARALLVTHVPPWDDRERARAEAAETYDGPTEAVRPGATFLV